MNEKIGYKVCTEDLRSSTCFYASVKYGIGEWVEPRMGNGPLAVFDNFKDAESFSVMDADRIFRCKYIPSKEKKLWYGDCGEEWECRSFLLGTVLADKVMLLEEVGNKNE
jgi:hypothetical protein